MNIRAITKNDLPICAYVIRTSFLTVAEEFGFTMENAPRFTAFSVTPERLEWQLENENRLMFAWYGDDGIVGFYSLRIDGGACELNNLCVLPEHRHKRIGAKLLAHAFNTARAHGCGRMDIGIVEENAQLRRWYELAGFVHAGTKKLDFFPFTCGYMSRELQTNDKKGGTK